MGLFLLKRLTTLLATLLGASAVVFLVLEILPGNAAQMLMGPDASPEAVAALASKLGLDQPALQQALRQRAGHTPPVILDTGRVHQRRASHQGRLRLAAMPQSHAHPVRSGTLDGL